MPVRKMTREEVVERFGGAKLVILRRPEEGPEIVPDGPNYGDIADGIAESCQTYSERKVNGGEVPLVTSG